jgi:dihydroorotate dehydrogenase electron transfer subunit
MPGQKAFNIKAKVISNKKTGDRYWHCLLGACGIAHRAAAGQFVEIKLSDDLQPLLRRPFSIHNASESGIEILYEVVGRGSEIFSQKKPGEFLDIIGPLGEGFDYSLPKCRDIEVSVLVAGGIGVAPLVFLAKKLETLRTKLETIVLIGARTKGEILCVEEFKKAGCSVKISTDDGSAGTKGRVTNLLENVLRKTHDPDCTMVFACGPKPMLKGVATISKKFEIPAQLSLESHMACGIGACLGCVVDTIDGYKRVCKEGPVFNAEEIVW